MKICSKCGVEKHLDDFANKNGKKESRCKACKNAYYREYWKRPGTWDKHRERLKSNKQAQIEDNHKLVVDRLASGCVDCGEQDIRVLEFDHLPEYEKLANVSNLMSGSRNKLIEEMNKCDVVCANCHKRRTYARSPSYRSRSWDSIGALL